MKKNSSILVVAFIVILVLGLCACNRVNGPQDDDGDDNGNDNIVFTITFDTNGGSAVASVTVKEGAALSLPADPTKDGFVFDGWYLDEAFVRQFVDTQTISADITLYAKWKPEQTKYTVTFVGGDDATGEAPESLQKVEGAEFSLPSNTFEKAGFDFVGWSDGRKTYAVGDSYTMPSHAVKFVAQWQRTYIVTYIIDDETFKTETWKEGEEIVLPTAPSKIGHEFAGWFSDENYNEEFATGQLVGENTTVYGHYIVLPKYKVNFMVYGKVYSSVESWGYEAIPTPKDVSRDSLALDGWYLDETYQTPYTDNYFETKALTVDVDIYSK